MGLDIIIIALISVMAILTLKTEILRTSIIFFGIMSLLASILFLLYQAPDVALAEAIIGSGLMTLVFLIALRQYRVFRICFTAGNGILAGERADRMIYQVEHDQITSSLEKFCHARELEPQLVISNRPLVEETGNPNYDIVLSRGESGLIEVHGNEENALLVEITWYLQWHHSDLDIVLHSFEEEP